MLDPRNLLGIPALYRAFQDALGGDARRRYVERYVRPVRGMRVLDIGCGPGDILEYLDPSVDYTGVDLSPTYIAAARKRFGHRGRFLCESVSQLAVREPASFDRVLANGVLHHLDDGDVQRLLSIARIGLKPEGCFVSIDPCLDKSQSPIARFLIRCDRGRFVRQRIEYLSLARETFPEVEHDLRHDLTRMPYTHLIMRCPSSPLAPPGRGAGGEGLSHLREHYASQNPAKVLVQHSGTMPNE